MINKKLYCVIPARGGSKRIKNKNIVMFNKKPLIYYSINAAKKTNLFKKIIVSTDSSRIKHLSEKFGAVVPFKRAKN
ncbi:acylneuraminate cytidylyltransferase family protein, partial [Candidatus Pelagibacter sp.]|nr:acylneuraminate cytidylyltransferase family protein [Candidatus Pelagibacter sp.]